MGPAYVPSLKVPDLTADACEEVKSFRQSLVQKINKVLTARIQLGPEHIEQIKNLLLPDLFDGISGKTNQKQCLIVVNNWAKKLQSFSVDYVELSNKSDLFSTQSIELIEQLGGTKDFNISNLLMTAFFADTTDAEKETLRQSMTIAQENNLFFRHLRSICNGLAIYKQRNTINQEIIGKCSSRVTNESKPEAIDWSGFFDSLEASSCCTIC